MNAWKRSSWIPWIGFVIALAIRMWGMQEPSGLVSDEVFFVRDGQAYSQQRSYFDPHPPLGKMLIAGSIAAIGDTPIGWRMTSALFGAACIPLSWYVVWFLTKKQRAATIAMTLVLFDGALLVDSRLGLINTTWIALALASFVVVLSAQEKRFPWWRIGVAGVLIGCSLATKWLAAAVWIPLIAYWLSIHWTRRARDRWLATTILILVPCGIYIGISLLHHVLLPGTETFFALQQHMLQYHLTVPSVGDPNAQQWWGWLIAWRPFPYFTGDGESAFGVLRSLPNPFIWWTGSLVMVISMVKGWRVSATRWLNILILFAWVPFAFVQRVMYSYHMILFGIWLALVLGIVLDRWIENHRRIVLGYLLGAFLCWVWFLPWYLNIPISPTQHQLRSWLPSWTIVR